MKLVTTLVLVVLGGLAAAAQTPAASDRIQGSITSINASAKHIAVTTDKGEAVTVTANDRSVILRMPAGVTDPKQGVKIELSTITADDKIIAIGKLSSDKKTLEGARLYILTKSDIAQIHKAEDEDWQKRGTAGVVSAIDPAAKTFTIKAGSKEVVVQSSDKTEFKRYSADSFKSTDAKPSGLGEVAVEDQVRVLGNKSAEGDKVAAERVFFGTFRHIQATIDSIDASANEVKVKELGTKKPFVIKLDSESKVKKLDPQVAAMLARRYNPAGAADDSGGAGRGGRGGRGGAPGAGGGGAPGGGRGPDIGQVFDRAPAATLDSLKAGDAVVLLTTAGTANKVTAVMMVAGVEDLLRSPAVRDIMSGWSLGGGGGGDGN